MTKSRRRILATLAAAALTAPIAAPARAADLPRGLRPLPRRDRMLDVAFKDAAGRDIGFVELRGKPAVAMFWATWCTICYGEMPKVDRLQRRLGDRAHIVPLSIDKGGMPAVQAYYKRRDLDVLNAYIDPEAIIASMMGIRGVPTAFVLDSDGRMAAFAEGPADWDSRAMEKFILSLNGL